MNHHLPKFLLLSIIFFLYPLLSQAQGLPLGAACTRTADCAKDSVGVDFGCRWSDLGKYQICKIVSAGATGCELAPYGENWCGDNLVCYKNTCTYDYLAPPAETLPIIDNQQPLGVACSRTADCAKDSNNVDLGCRWSDIGKYQICKIVSQKAEGCALAPYGENWCGDNLICRENKCYYDWEQPPETQFGFFGNIFAQVKLYFTWANFKTYLPLFINFILGLALILGLVICLKGYMKRKYCQDFEPDLRQGIMYMTAGGIIFGLAAILGLVLPLIWSRIL